MPPKKFDITPKSKFDPKLYEQHAREAAEFAQRCQQEGRPLLDPCGPRGDLYFLLKAQMAAAKPKTKPAPKPTSSTVLS